MLRPRNKCYRPFRKPLEVYRSQTGDLATDRLIKKVYFSGCRLFQPVRLKWSEVFLIWLGFIR